MTLVRFYYTHNSKSNYMNQTPPSTSSGYRCSALMLQMEHPEPTDVAPWACRRVRD